MVRRCALLILLFLCSPLWALESLVEGDWLRANRDAKGLFLLDIQSPENYRHAHIPGSVNASYRLWRTGKESGSPGMLPPLKRLERLLGGIGIGNDSAVVIIAAGGRPGDMAAASRVFWSLKLLGHAQVAILDGGLAGYARQATEPLEQRPGVAKATRYQAAFDSRLVVDAGEIQRALRDGVQLLDARTLGEYLGVTVLGPKERPGTLPGARHLPFDWLVGADGRIRDRVAASALFRYAGLDPGRDGTIHFCHTGNRAALTWFVDFAILGHRNAKLYDGSMQEWAAQKGLPMETRIELNRH